MPAARIVLVVYALLMLGGGIAGWRAARSKPSLVSGLGSAAILLAALAWSRSDPRAGFATAALVAGALAVVFLVRLAKTRKAMPAGGLLVLSIAAAAFFLYAMGQGARP